jgi:acetoin utilization deacetylase AcuC-like enzyme
MVALYRSVMVPVIQAFNPGLILVSAGFDAHAMDPIGGMEISSAGFGALAGLIRDAAIKIKAPVVYSLEGGYNLDALRDSVKAVLDVMKGESAPKIEERFTPEIDEIIKIHSRFWSL